MFTLDLRNSTDATGNFLWCQINFFCTVILFFRYKIFHRNSLTISSTFEEFLTSKKDFDHFFQYHCLLILKTINFKLKKGSPGERTSLARVFEEGVWNKIRCDWSLLNRVLACLCAHGLGVLGMHACLCAHLLDMLACWRA